MTVKETIEQLSQYPDDFVVVITHHKGEPALVALSRETYEKGKSPRPLYHVISDRRKQERDAELSDDNGPASGGENDIH